ncbi:MAG: hypothetical protein JSW71_06385 [Gemmatimonadota bacterium]|nr:MAG: hypothetical protein JSW71_06385 [Gemmatimonadota bacterium]
MQRHSGIQSPPLAKLDGSLGRRAAQYGLQGLGERWGLGLVRDEGAYNNLHPHAFKHGGYGSGNLIWDPLSAVSVRIELLSGQRVNKDGQSGTATRLQLMTHFTLLGDEERNKGRWGRRWLPFGSRALTSRVASASASDMCAAYCRG